MLPAPTHCYPLYLSLWFLLFSRSQSLSLSPFACFPFLLCLLGLWFVKNSLFLVFSGYPLPTLTSISISTLCFLGCEALSGSLASPHFISTTSVYFYGHFVSFVWALLFPLIRFLYIACRDSNSCSLSCF